MTEPLSSQPQPPNMSFPPVTTPLKFLKWQTLYETEKPFQVFINIPPDAPDQRTTNLVFEDIATTITDVRSLSQDESPGMDSMGFKYVKDEFDSDVDWEDKESVERGYLPAVERLLRRELGMEENVGKVKVFDWRLRKNAPEARGSVIDLNNRTEWLRPAMQVHVDQSPAAIIRRVHLHMKDEADELLEGRVRLINVWRPLIPSVLDWPLTVCSGSTANPKDLVESDHIRRQYMGSTMYLQNDPKQRFYYMHKQGMENALVFKIFDSDPEVAAQVVPHASFRHPDCPEEGEFVPRKSIEVRALVFTDS